MSGIFNIFSDFHSVSLCAILSSFAIFLIAFNEVIVMNDYL